MKKSVLCKNIYEIVEEVKGNEKFIKTEDMPKLIAEMRTLIEMNNELNYLDDIKTDILSLKSSFDSNNNIIVKGNVVDQFELRELTVEVLKVLSEQGLVLVIEPNNNIYIDMDIDKLIEVCRDILSIENVNVLMWLQKLQVRAIVDIHGNLKEETNELYKELVVATDFEKNEVRFNFMCGVLSEMEGLVKVYSKK